MADTMVRRRSSRGCSPPQSRQVRVPELAFGEYCRAWREHRKHPDPILGAALAHYTVFSLAPLMLVLLAVSGFLYGGSEAAQEKIIRQPGYFVDHGFKRPFP